MKVSTWNGHAINDGTNYQTVIVNDPLPYGIPAVSATLLNRTGRWPLVSGIQRGQLVRYLVIYIRAGSSSELSGWFDNEDETPKTLVVTDADGTSNSRYFKMLCLGLREVPLRAGRVYVATMVAHGDPRLRFVTGDSSTWNISASGDTKVIANGGQDDAYPNLRIVPVGAKTTGYGKRIWIKIKWPVSDGALRHPTDITKDSFNTSTLISGGKMQSMGEDLHVWVDGQEIDRWLDGINTTTTKVWCNLDWYPIQQVDLKTAIASSGAVSTIEADGDISAFPSAGLLEIGTEIFIYASKSNAERKFTDCTRARRGSSMAAHAAGDTIEWIQHDIFILYDHPTARTPDTDDTQKPIINLATSTNGSWDFDEFGSADPRTGQWSFLSYSQTTYKTTAYHATNADPFSALGITGVINPDGMWYIRHPCLISNVNFQNGEKYSGNLNGIWDAGIVSWDEGGNGFEAEDSIAEPSSATTWESWSDSEAIGNKKQVGFYLRCWDNIVAARRLEVADVTLTLANTPDITLGAEEDNYDLDCIIANTTTGESLRVYYPFLATGEIINVNTYDKTVTRTYTGTSENIYNALTLVEGPRRDWLRLTPGNNTLAYTEDGATGVTVTVTWEKRNYE